MKDKGKTREQQVETLEKRVKEKTADLVESEERYRTIFESCREGILILDADFNIQSTNPAAAAMLDYGQPEEMIGIPIVALYKDPKQKKSLVTQLMKKGYIENVELNLKCKDNRDVHMLGSAMIHADEAGRIRYIHMMISDISKRRRAEEKEK